MEKVYSLPKDSLKKIVQMMEYVEEHDEQITEKEFIKKFGKEGNIFFQRYCVGGLEPYAQTNEQKYKLTQKGIRRLHELKEVLLKRRHTLIMIVASILLTIATVILAVVTIIQINS